MVKLTIAIAAFVAAVLPIVAGDCRVGLGYCGFNLMDNHGYSERELAYKAGAYMCSEHDRNVLKKTIFRCDLKSGHLATGDPVAYGICNNECKDGGYKKN
ncbi:hypothetical protein V501_09665 [Pseudogymnoascus sp. VKM F-4519 (FW-2642)]|nr:hypothetical protein V501_09665 [Pseudogymnoascus sp. VKM F-4519 (FW-2642)]